MKFEAHQFVEAARIEGVLILTHRRLLVDQFRRGMLTQLFYVSNWYHDRLFQLGFDEAAGNFQQLNFSGQGAGADRVLALAAARLEPGAAR